MKNIQYHFERLGPIFRADVKLSGLTVVCGENNTGKTFLTNSIYSSLAQLAPGGQSLFNSIIDFQISDDDVVTLTDDHRVSVDLRPYLDGLHEAFENFSTSFSNKIHSTFAAPSRNFADTKVNLLSPELKLEDCSVGKYSISVAKGVRVNVEREQQSEFVEISIIGDEFDLSANIARFIIGGALFWVLLNNTFGNVHISSAERTGAAIFQKELDFKRSKLFDLISNGPDNLDMLKLLRTQVSDYPDAVTSNVDFIREVSELSKDDSQLFLERPDIWGDLVEIMGGQFRIRDNDIEFQPEARKSSIKRLPVASGSSASRSLLDLSFYIRHQAKFGDILIVDEPELNLHPLNQVKFARLLAKLMNSGIRVFITTHSDYIIRELSILLMLGKGIDLLSSIEGTEKYEDPNIMLDPSSVSVYYSSEELMDVGRPRRQRRLTLVESEVSSSEGIIIPKIEEVIDFQNSVYDALIWN